MNKLKMFLENFLVYGLGSIISKFIPLLMIPLITRLMPDSTYFGISDLSNTMTSFMCAIAIMGMYDAMYRMFFEKENEEYKKSICSTTLVFTLIASLLVFVFMLFYQETFAQIFFGDKKYSYLIYITAIATLVGATNSIISAPTRMQNKKKIFLITNTISPILSYAISIPLLFHGHYIIALPIAGVISGFTIEITFFIMNHQWFNWKRFDFALLKQLLVIALPLFPNFLIYWIFNSSDKLMITNLLNVSETGIYSIGSKLGHASQLIYTAFAGGWQYFAFSTMKESNQVKLNSLIFEYLGIISYIVFAFICVWSYKIYQILFIGDYVNGYIVAPYLFLAPLLQMLYQVAGNQFLIIKKTWPNMLILSSGAILNIIINLTLIPTCGIEGAAIATLIGYIISNIICVIVLIKMHLMELSKKFILCTLIMSGYVIFWRFFLTENITIGTLASTILVIIFSIFYKEDIIKLINEIKININSK